MAYKKKATKEEQQKKVLIGVALLVLVLAFGKTLWNKLVGGFAMIGAKKAGDNIYNDQNSSNPANVRLPFIRSVCDTVKNEISSFNQDESLIVQTMNTLANGQEAATASAYYSSAYGRSLRSELQSALDSGWNPGGWGAATSFNDIKDYIRQNLV